MNKKLLFFSILTILTLSAFSLGFTDVIAASAPSVSTGPVDFIAARNVYLNMSVNPNGSYANVWFQLDTNQPPALARGHQGAGSGTTAINVKTGVINLKLGTTYYYRAVAQNAYGTTYGNTRTFTTPTDPSGIGSSDGTSGSYDYAYNSNYSTGSGSGSTSNSGAPTAPQVATNGPVSISATSATINGSVNPNNVYTRFWFEFGQNQSLGSKTSIQPVGSDNQWQLVTGNLTGLQINTTYYYRVVAQNNQGTAFGNVLSFKTTSSGSGISGSGSSTGAGSGQTGGTGTSSSGSGSSTTGSGGTSGSNTSGSGKKSTGGTGSIFGGLFGSGNSGGSGGSGSTGGTNSGAGTNGSGGTGIYGDDGFGGGVGGDGIYGVSGNDSSLARPSFISLEYSLNDSDALVLVVDDAKPMPGEEFSYTVVYKNDTNKPFYNSQLRVIIPSETTYVGANAEPIEVSGSIITFDLGDINPDDRGAVTVLIKINEEVLPGSNLIFTSILGYRDRFGNQLSSTSYMTLKIGGSNGVLAASFGSMFSKLLNIWLLILALLVVMGILISRYLFIRRRKLETVKEQYKINDEIEDISSFEKKEVFVDEGNIPSTFQPIGPVRPSTR